MITAEEAWNDYVRLCEVGGTKSFLGLVEYANLKSHLKMDALALLSQILKLG